MTRGIQDIIQVPRPDESVVLVLTATGDLDTVVEVIKNHGGEILDRNERFNQLDIRIPETEVNTIYQMENVKHINAESPLFFAGGSGN